MDVKIKISELLYNNDYTKNSITNIYLDSVKHDPAYPYIELSTPSSEKIMMFSSDHIEKMELRCIINSGYDFLDDLAKEIILYLDGIELSDNNNKKIVLNYSKLITSCNSNGIIKHSIHFYFFGRKL